MSSEPVPLVGRYRFGRRVEAARNAVVWFAFDDKTGGQVVASLLPAPRAAAYAKAVGVTDPHLAPVIEIIREIDPAALPPGASARGSSVVVAAHVAGEALYGTLKAGPLRRPEAVRCAMDLASALAALHRRGAIHGAFSPLSVIKARLDTGPTPILTQVLMPPLGAFASPERAQGGGTAQLDDVWSLHATLYAMLTGDAPVRVDVGGRIAFQHKSMSHFGPPDEILDDVLDRGLARSARERTRSAEQLEADLVVWLTRNAQRRGLTEPPPRAAAESATVDLARSSVHEELRSSGKLAFASPASLPPPGERETTPAPPPPAPAPVTEERAELPPPEPAPLEQAEATPAEPAEGRAPSPVPPAADSLTPAAPPEPVPARPTEDPPSPAGSSASIQPVASSGAPRVVAWALVAAAALAAGFWFVRARTPAATASAPAITSAPAPLPEATTPRAATAPAATAQSAAPPLASATSVAAAPPVGQSAAERTACVVRYFPADTFVTPQDLSFVCDAGDARGHVKTLYSRLVAAGGGASTPGMREWATLDWYELAVFAIVRHGCCPEAPPLELPPAEPPCDALGPTLDKLGDAVARHGEVELRVLGFDKNAVCLHTQAAGRYRYTSHPYWGGQASFAGFMKRNLP